MLDARLSWGGLQALLKRGIRGNNNLPINHQCIGQRQSSELERRVPIGSNTNINRGKTCCRSDAIFAADTPTVSGRRELKCWPTPSSTRFVTNEPLARLSLKSRGTFFHGWCFSDSSGDRARRKRKSCWGRDSFQQSTVRKLFQITGPSLLCLPTFCRH